MKIRISSIVLLCIITLCFSNFLYAASDSDTDTDTDTNSDRKINRNKNGMIVSPSSNGAKYLIDEGRLRSISNRTFNSLFATKNCIQENDELIETTVIGDDFPTSALLVEAVSADNEIWLLDNGKRRSVSANAMSKYCFSWNGIETISDQVLKQFPKGPAVK